MYYQDDWLLRQIELFGLFIKRLRKRYHAEQMSMDELERLSLTRNALLRKVYDLVEQHKICEAENLIYDRIDNHNEDLMEAAILFYYRINKMNDVELKKYDFSRNEIFSGLKRISEVYNMDSVYIYLSNMEEQ
jgi:hypothetical protein